MSNRARPKSRRETSVQESQNADELSDKQSHSVNKLVRYVLFKSGSGMPLKKSDIQKAISLDNARTFDKVIAKAKIILEDVYGYTIKLAESINNNKFYVVHNSLPYLDIAEDLEESDKPADNVNNVLSMLVLSHIFMSNNSCTQESLFAFLASLGIDAENIHVQFGNVLEHITKHMVSLKLLQIETNSLNTKSIYHWGTKAECSVSKKAILSFVAKIYGKRPQDWSTFYAQANEQWKSDNVNLEVGEE